MHEVVLLDCSTTNRLIPNVNSNPTRDTDGNYRVHKGTRRRGISPNLGVQRSVLRGIGGIALSLEGGRSGL